ncbi:MAG: D-alanyl-D-alanine carboxypeptidase/D-alanyl-D-alanine-endopeptidase [Candidatus Acidiferrales bacterium]
MNDIRGGPQKNGAAGLWIALTMVAALCAATVNCTNLAHAAGTRSGAAPGLADAGLAAAKSPHANLGKFSVRASAALSSAAAQKASWGIWIADASTGETLYEQNADRLFAPASNLKLATTALAAASLPSDFRFRTTLEARGTLSAAGTLTGDLVLVGRGDPDLSNRKFPYAGKVEREGPPEKVLAELADAAVAHGLKEIRGDVAGDDSYFPFDPYPAGWTVGDLYFGFGAPVSAIVLNDNIVSIEVSPGPQVGDPAALVVSPFAGDPPFGYEVVTGAAGTPVKFAVVRQASAKTTLLRGSIPIGAPSAKLSLAMDDPAEYAARALKLLLEARGVHITGEARAIHGAPPKRGDVPELPSVPAANHSGPDSRVAPIPPDAPSDASASGQSPAASVTMPTPATSSVDNGVVLAEHQSPPLMEMIRVVNKVSENLHAEILLRTVAKEKAGSGTIDDGIKVAGDFLKSVGIADGDVVQEDGSGLSPANLVTPRAFGNLLLWVSHQPWANDYLATLPIAGVDGTLESRMKNSQATGRIFAKTGSLEHVHTISGYATTVRGERLVFSIMDSNDAEKANDATAVIDSLCVAMVEEIGPAKPTKPGTKPAPRKYNNR